jgi:replicative DNA helicase
MESGLLKDKVPPYNEEAEVACLGALLLDPEALPTVLQYLRSDDFYRRANQQVYDAIVGLANDAQGIDLITVTERLRAEGLLESCGGAAYVARLTSAVPTAANIEYYARIVQACSIRRSLDRIASQIIANSHDQSLEVSYIIEEAERQVFEITDKQHVGAFLEARQVVMDTIEAIQKRTALEGQYTGVATGYHALDQLTAGFQKAEFIVIGARPSVGKTALALSMAANMAIKHRVPVGFFTLEMSAMALMQRLLAADARVDSHRLRSGLLKKSDITRLSEAAGRIYEAPLYIADAPNMRLLDLRAHARRMKSRHNIAIIFIDYLTLITSEERDQPRHEQIAEISRSLKALARELDIPVVAASQVRREAEGQKPSLADLRESGSIEQDADVVLFLHRERGGDAEPGSEIETDLIVAKQRNGPLGSLKLAFVPQYVRFEDLSRDAPPE